MITYVVFVEGLDAAITGRKDTRQVLGVVHVVESPIAFVIGRVGTAVHTVRLHQVGLHRTWSRGHAHYLSPLLNDCKLMTSSASSAR